MSSMLFSIDSANSDSTFKKGGFLKRIYLFVRYSNTFHVLTIVQTTHKFAKSNTWDLSQFP